MNFGSLPDTTPVNSILKRIANEKNWAEKDVENDLAILERHRIVYVHDLRSLSKDSWTEIELLPLVKDLLRGAIDPDYLNSNNLPSSTLSSGSSSNGSSNISQDDDDKKEKKKDKKDKKDDKKDDKDKKEKKKEKEKEKEKEKKKDKKKGFKSTSNLGTPVKPTILTRPPVIYQPQPQSLNDTSSILSDSSISHDHITMQNTIRNGGGSTPTDIKFIPALPTVTTANMNNGSGESSSSTTSEDNDDDFLLSPTTRRKSVSFSNETAIGVAATEKGALDEKKEKKKDKKDKKDKKKKKDNM